MQKKWANCSAMPLVWKCSEQQIYENPKLSYKLLNQEILKTANLEISRWSQRETKGFDQATLGRVTDAATFVHT